MGMLKVGDELLRVNSLTEGMRGTLFAFLLKVRRYSDRNGEPYLNFWLRTADSATIIGRKFRVSHDNLVGDEILAAQRSVVKLGFEVQIFRGSYVLLVDTIRLSDEVSSDLFFDSYGEIDDTYEWLCKRCGTLPEKFKRVSLISVMDGKQGAILYLLKSAFCALSAYDSEPFWETLVDCFSGCIGPYVDYLQLIDKYEYVPKSDLFGLVWESSGESAILSDVLSALVGLSQAEHLISHLIVRAVQRVTWDLNTINKIKISPIKVPIEIGGDHVVMY